MTLILIQVLPSQITTADSTTTIISPGTTIQLLPNLGSISYTYYKETFQDSVQISGSFSTSYSAELYIVTPSQFSSGAWVYQYVAMFEANKGQGQPTSVNWNLQPGQYYFVIANAIPGIQSTFTTNDGIKAIPIGSTPSSGGSSGIPEFPVQPGVALLFAVVIVMSYLFARRGLRIGRQAPV